MILKFGKHGGCFLAALVSVAAIADPVVPETAPLPPPSDSSVLQPIPTASSLPAAELPPAREVPPPPPVIEAQPAPAPPPVSNPETKPLPSFRDLSIPPYQVHRPQWGIELTGSVRGLGNQDWLVGSTGVAERTRGFQLQIDFQPRFFQEWGVGVFSLGVSGALFPVLASVGVTEHPYSVWEAGGQIRYQLRYFREQPLVPVVAYHFEYLNYDLTNYPAAPAATKSAVLVTGPSVGLWFLMNILESSAASELFNSLGISRTYLLAEMKFLKGSNSEIAVSGSALFFGLRFEF